MKSPKRKEKDAHVLFIDIVGFSLRGMGEQQIIIENLIKIVKNVLKRYNLVVKKDSDPALLPTGDGMALVFQTDDQAPLKCAWFLAKSLKRYNKKAKKEEKLQEQFQIRMGIHSGKVRRVRGLKPINFAGPALNVAQRVMSCGGPGHILASLGYWNRLRGLPYESLFKDEEDYFVKGGMEPVYNLHGLIPFNDSRQISAGKSEKPEKIFFVNKTSIPKQYRDRSSLAFFHYQEFSKALKAIYKMEWIDHKYWGEVYNILKKHAGLENPKVRFELISLIDPKKWKSDDWIKYQREIYNITRIKLELLDLIDAKRIHVLSKDTIEDSKMLNELIALIISEFMGNIKSRVIFIPNDKVELDEEMQTYSFEDFSLFDYGTYRTGILKDVIFSNIVPYFKGEKPWGITKFDTIEHSIFHTLQANFYRAWDNIVPVSGCTLVTLLKGFGLIDDKANEEILQAVNGYLESLGFKCKMDELRSSLSSVTTIVRDITKEDEEKERELLRTLSRDGKKILG